MSRDLSEYQKKRIRTAGVETMNRMVHQEAYWTRKALLLILDRVDTLTHESPKDGELAASAAVEILARIPDASADLRGLTLATHGSALRSCGRHAEALRRYDEALAVPGLSPQARCGILRKSTMALVYSGRVDEGLAAVESALRLQPDDITALGVRSWARLVAGDYTGTLRDCLLLFQRADPRLNRRSYLAAIVNSSAILRMESFQPAPAFVEELLKAVELCSRQLPQSGSSFYSLALVRGLLYRAEALVIGRQGRYPRGIKLLKKAFNKLIDRFPDDALLVAVDLAYFHAHTGDDTRASQACSLILEAASHLKLKPHSLGIQAARSAVERGSLNKRQAIELRALWMSPAF